MTSDPLKKSADLDDLEKGSKLPRGGNRLPPVAAPMLKCRVALPINQPRNFCS